jgi:hypothetical protein
VLLYRVILFWVPLLMVPPAFISLGRGLDVADQGVRRPA